MTKPYAYKTFTVPGDPDAVRGSMTRSLLDAGHRKTGESEHAVSFVYSRIGFSSKRPLTCISRLSLDFRRDGNGTVVKAGATFTKIRWFTIFIFALVCGVIPAGLGIWMRGYPDIPPMSYLGIPLGFMVHYHVRGRAFRALRRLAYAAGGSNS